VPVLSLIRTWKERDVLSEAGFSVAPLFGGVLRTWFGSVWSARGRYSQFV